MAGKALPETSQGLMGPLPSAPHSHWACQTVSVPELSVALTGQRLYSPALPPASACFPPEETGLLLP